MSARRLLLAVLAVGAVTGCTGSSGPAATPTAGPTSPPCGPDAEELSLGSPYTYASRGPAYFRTDGGPVYLTARRFEQGGPLDPARGRTLFAIGPGSTAPVVDRQAATVSGARAEVAAAQDEWVAVDLPAGRWWLLSSSGGDVRVAACRPGGVSDAEPVDGSDASGGG